MGWSFGKPFRMGGSSRFLTLAFLILPDEHLKKPKKVIAHLYQKFGWLSEKKASQATPSQKLLFCNHANRLLQTYQDIQVDVITVKKANVDTHIRSDSNKLYNYMVGLVVQDHVKDQESFALVLDERSIKVKSQNSLNDYLQIKLWFDVGSSTRVNCCPTTSTYNYTLQFVDWIAHCIWEYYEDGNDAYFKALGNVVRKRQLFFQD